MMLIKPHLVYISCTIRMLLQLAVITGITGLKSKRIQHCFDHFVSIVCVSNKRIFNYRLNYNNWYSFPFLIKRILLKHISV